MIVMIKGNVGYPITLDPTVWIFDDRKVELEKAFTEPEEQETFTSNFQKPPVNRSISKMEGEAYLKNSYVIPLHDFLNNAEPKADAAEVEFIKSNGENEKIALEDAKNGYLLFSLEGKPLREDGPVHFYYKDGSNQDNPIKYIKEIHIH
ncbi:hypothetical protein J18TS1_13490 [Oceanobacillus oncorhynchi subsp. incaldanensis]|uniref:Peptidyl-prolyl cis-trans isomerase n=1 Tax=Oceanobacillus oncorhynchi TaxID=545501 RepID=A0A0A1MYI6_9BACI|nr:hypothetical protein [Oceanobacillus oncorhynchi]GIO18249.1 hypothetical protein J18TS1_13490 [Oceanobacillus oncorhynchi subsp. incaldanensis]CEI84427.1 hypothetical protein BN997_04375 [Oceanobacillus oncorhynchi]